MTSGILFSPSLSLPSPLPGRHAPYLRRVAAAALLFATAAVATVSSASAQVPLAPPNPAAEPDAHSLGVPKDAGATKPKDKILQAIYKLKEKKDEPTFVELRDKAKAAGASNEELLEAELTFCFRGLLWDHLTEVAPRFKEAVAKWNLDNAAYLRTPGQPEAMNQLVQAVLSAESGDMKGFESSIKEAIWLNPEEAEFYSQFIVSYRRKARMASVTMPMTAKIGTYDGKTTTLGELIKDKKALLIGFWATFSPPSVAGMGELADIDKQQLAAQGVACVAINIDPSVESAVAVRNEQKQTMPWLVDAAGRPIYTAVGHTSFPMAVLVTPEGKLLYIGDPLQDDIGLKEALEKVGVKYKLPTDEPIPEP